jgi:hypothetical protein
MSPSIFDRIVVADKMLTPGIVHRRLTRDRKVARPASTSSSIRAIAASTT